MHQRRPLSAALAALALTLSMVAAVRDASATTPVLPTPTGLPSAIEPLATDVADTVCDLRVRPGTSRLAALLKTTYPATTYNTVYPCGSDGTRSEHYDGRAIDWMVSARTTTGLATANAFLNWLLATDRAGHTFAMARRLGVQYVIFNNRIWGTWDHKWDPYQNCLTDTSIKDDSYCHRNHVHISLGWNGAMARTSYWTKTVSTATDYGPCRPSDLNWSNFYSGPNPGPCPSYAVVTAPSTASSLKKTLVAYSGARLFAGQTGPMVTAVQRALGFTGTLGTLNSATVALIRSFQAAHRLLQSGGMDRPTWRALLAAVR